MLIDRQTIQFGTRSETGRQLYFLQLLIRLLAIAVAGRLLPVMTCWVVTLSLLLVPTPATPKVAASEFTACGPSYDVGRESSVVNYWRADGRVMLRAKDMGKFTQKLTWKGRRLSQAGIFEVATKNKYLVLWVNDSITTSSSFWYEYRNKTRSGLVRIQAGAPPKLDYSPEGCRREVVSNLHTICFDVTGLPGPVLSVSNGVSMKTLLLRASSNTACLQVDCCQNVTVNASNCLGADIMMVPGEKCGVNCSLLSDHKTSKRNRTFNIRIQNFQKSNSPADTTIPQSLFRSICNQSIGNASHPSYLTDSDSGIVWWTVLAPLIMSLLTTGAIVAVIASLRRKKTASASSRDILRSQRRVAAVSESIVHTYEEITELSSDGGDSAVNCYDVDPYIITPGQAIIDRLEEENPYLKPVQHIMQDREETTDHQAVVDTEVQIGHPEEESVQQRKMLSTYV